MAKGEEEFHDQCDAAASSRCSSSSSSNKKPYWCEICKKGFTSVYALNGHTRMHSPHCAQFAKPLLPSSSPPLRKVVFSFSRRISTAAHGDNFFTSWPVGCKRKRARFSRPRHPGNSCSEHYAANAVEVEVDPLMEEAAYTLMLMANGGY